MRFHRLTKKGVWKQIVERLCGEADLEEFIPDSTVVRVHQHGARARKKNRRPAGHRALLRGADDEVPCGHRHLQAPALLEGFSPKRVIADRAYDADSFIGKVWAFGAEAVIPTRHNRVEQREYDRHWYKNRNLVERFFNWIKQFRRIARHYEKLARNFMAMIDIACIFVWLL